MAAPVPAFTVKGAMEARKLQVLVDSLRRLIRKTARGHIHNLLHKVRPADIGRVFELLNQPEKNFVFLLLAERERKLAAGVLSEMQPAQGVELLALLKDEDAAHLLQELGPDDATEFISAMPEEQAARVLALMREEEARGVQDLLQYAEETAGRIMTTEFFALPEETMAKDAVAALRDAAEKEMVFYVYVVDTRSHLIGVCSLRQLLLANPETSLRQFMTADVISVNTDTDQEEVARIVSRYDLLAVPVVDSGNRLVGIITVDDVADVIMEEATEDFYKMAGTSDEEALSKSVIHSARLRLPWLLASFFGGILATYILSRFEGTLSRFVMLAFFIPIINGMGGNIGSQSSTIIVRGLATGGIEVQMLWRVLLKQIRIAILLGLIYGVMLGTIAYVFGLLKGGMVSPLLFGAMIGLALCTSMVIAATIGTFTPITLQKLNIDPAVATVPFVSTSVDIIGGLSYLSMASYLLPMIVRV